MSGRDTFDEHNPDQSSPGMIPDVIIVINIHQK